MTDLWTAEDVELVAQTQWVIDRNPAPWEKAQEQSRALYREDAAAVLAALAEAGRLAPNGTTEQFGVGEPGRRVMPYATEVVARGKAKELQLALFRRWVGPWLPVQPEPAPEKPK